MCFFETRIWLTDEFDFQDCVIYHHDIFIIILITIFIKKYFNLIF